MKNFFRIRAYVDYELAPAAAALLLRSKIGFEFSAGTPHAEFTLMESSGRTLPQEQEYWVTIFALAGVPEGKVFVSIRA